MLENKSYIVQIESVDVVDCPACLFFFHCLLFKKWFRRTTATSDEIKLSIEEYDDAFIENIGFSVY